MTATGTTKSVRLDEQVAQELKVLAAARGTTVQALVESALLSWCRAQARKEGRQANAR